MLNRKSEVIISKKEVSEVMAGVSRHFELQTKMI
jgi:hypothetical protein